MGDEHLFSVFSRHLAPHRLCVYPRNAQDVLWSLRSIASSASLLLGGGTYLGGPRWRSLIERTSFLVEKTSSVTVGAGAMGILPPSAGHERITREIDR